MDGFNTIIATIIATVLATGIISLLSVAWRNREWLRIRYVSIFKKETETSEVISIEEYIKMFRMWKSEDEKGITISIKDCNIKTTYHKVVKILLLKNDNKGFHILILNFATGEPVSKRVPIVDDKEYTRIIKTLYFREVLNGRVDRQGDDV